ncbi:MAG: CvpA family protein [Gammaproteobacteria bacterium]|jgi:membrane protein required for colicin V production|nr:CvpA family protein [Gammaproteobacteria bacterium]
MTITLTTFDYILIAIIIVSSLIGFMRGFVHESLSLLIVLTALWLAFEYAARAEFYFVDIIPNTNARLWAAVISIILVVLLIGAVIRKIMLHFMNKSKSTYLDKFVGFLFGILRGFVVVGLVVWGISNTTLKEKPWWQDSGMVKYLQKSVAWLDQYRSSYTSVANNDTDANETASALKETT